MQIAHICKKDSWEDALEKGFYDSSSLEDAGFIHCCRPEQIMDVANRFYKNESELVVLWIETSKVQSEIRFEQADGDTFPHIYGMINLDAVERVTPLALEDENKL